MKANRAQSQEFIPTMHSFKVSFVFVTDCSHVDQRGLQSCIKYFLALNYRDGYFKIQSIRDQKSLQMSESWWRILTFAAEL